MASDPGSKFIGCIVSIRTHPKANGVVGHITGTVSAIGRNEPSLTLNNGVQNGLPLPDDYIIRADEIDSLELITAVADDDEQDDDEEEIDIKDEVGSQLRAEEEHRVNNISAQMNTIGVSDNQPKYKSFAEFASASKALNITPSIIPFGTGASNGLISAGGDNKSTVKKDSNGPQIVYSATAFENSYKSQRKSAFNAYNNNNSTPTSKPTAQQFTPTQNNILAKLGLGANVVGGTSPASKGNRSSKAIPINNKASNGHPRGSQARSPRVKPGSSVRKDEAFEMSTAEIKAHEFDFEENLAKFDKLPVTNAPKPVPVNMPKFKSCDTTLQANRSVESVTFLDGTKSTKNYTTDTGVVIPSVDIVLRNKLMQLANKQGLTTAKTIEAMGRAVVQVCLPLLGDSYRLSPERTKDRPCVLICANSNWQGACGLATARILATLGVATVVWGPTVEKTKFVEELKLYLLCEESYVCSTEDIPKRKFDLIVLAMDGPEASKFSFDPAKLPLTNTDVVLIDPPLLKSFNESLSSTSSRMGAGIGQNKIVIVNPALPLPYRTSSNLKMYLVNLGVPKQVFDFLKVKYRSPYGDKLVVQVFGSKHEDE